MWKLVALMLLLQPSIGQVLRAQPLFPDNSDALLGVRQIIETCEPGDIRCTDNSGDCCPIDSVCSTTRGIPICASVGCFGPICTGILDGLCCTAGYTCDYQATRCVSSSFGFSLSTQTPPSTTEARPTISRTSSNLPTPAQPAPATPDFTLPSISPIPLPSNPSLPPTTVSLPPKVSIPKLPTFSFPFTSDSTDSFQSTSVRATQTTRVVQETSGQEDETASGESSDISETSQQPSQSSVTQESPSALPTGEATRGTTASISWIVPVVLMLCMGLLF